MPPIILVGIRRPFGRSENFYIFFPRGKKKTVRGASPHLASFEQVGLLRMDSPLRVPLFVLLRGFIDQLFCNIEVSGTFF